MMMRVFICTVLFALLFVRPAAAAQPLNPFEGRLVKSGSSPAVYYVGLDGKRHAFPNAKIYFSWYQDFAGVDTIREKELAALPLGKNVTYRPASRLVKISDVPEVYAIEPGGVLRNIPTEEAAKALYGPNWSKLVDDLDISFFFDYEIGGVIDIVDGRPLYPRGTAVNYQSESFIIDKTSDGVFTMRPITPEAWLANRFDALNRQSIVDADWREFYELGLPIVGVEASYLCPACGTSLTEPSVSRFEERTSPNNRYSIRAPSGWGAFFELPILEEPSTVLQAMESITDDGVQISAVRFPRQDMSFESFVLGRRQSLANAELVPVADARGLLRLPEHTLVSVSEQGSIQRLTWSQLRETDDAFYTVEVSLPYAQLSAYREVISQAFMSFEVHQAVTE